MIEHLVVFSTQLDLITDPESREMNASTDSSTAFGIWAPN